MLGYRRRYVDPKSFSWGRRLTDDLNKRHPDGKYYFDPAMLNRKNLAWYIVEGETSLMTMYAAGISNSIATFGCNDVPNTLLDDLASINIKEARVIVDNDKPGQDLAKLCRKYLRKSDIKFIPLSLEGLVEEKGDVNDLWAKCGFSPISFRRHITRLKELELPPYQEPRPRKRNVQTNVEGFTRLRAEIAIRLPEYNYKSNGFTKNFSCVNPEHEDENASAGFSLELGYKCFVCGQRHDIQVAQWLGIDHWRDIVFGEKV